MPYSFACLFFSTSGHFLMVEAANTSTRPDINLFQKLRKIFIKRWWRYHNIVYSIDHSPFYPVLNKIQPSNSINLCRFSWYWWHIIPIDLFIPFLYQGCILNNNIFRETLFLKVATEIYGNLDLDLVDLLDLDPLDFIFKLHLGTGCL